jgi:large subunit ribosomal protein L14e
MRKKSYNQRGKKMIEIGRLCVKIAGRDARKKCVIVDVLDDNFVLIDGETRRRKCNIKHLEALDQVIKIKKNAAHSTIVSEFKKLDIEIKEKKSKPKTKRPKKVRKKKAKSGTQTTKESDSSPEAPKEEKKPKKEEKAKKK